MILMFQLNIATESSTIVLLMSAVRWQNIALYVFKVYSDNFETFWRLPFSRSKI